MSRISFGVRERKFGAQLHQTRIAGVAKHPESLRGGSSDCFVARAPRNDGARGGIAILQLSANLQDTPSQSRGAPPEALLSFRAP